MPKCPRNCSREYVERWPNGDTPQSSCYLCCACGVTFFITKVVPRSEERQLWKDKYGDE